jgi:hypothetical protein
MNGPSADVGFLEYALSLLDLERERRPEEVDQFLEDARLDGLVEMQAFAGHVVLWPSRRLLEFLDLEP